MVPCDQLPQCGIRVFFPTKRDFLSFSVALVRFGPPNQSQTHLAEQVFKTGIVAHWIKKWRSFRESRHSRRISLPFMESHTMKGIRTMLRAADSQLIEARQN